MTDQHSERILEETHLREILEEAERQLKQAHEAVERKETELQELKREIGAWGGGSFYHRRI